MYAYYFVVDGVLVCVQLDMTKMRLLMVVGASALGTDLSD